MIPLGSFIYIFISITTLDCNRNEMAKTSLTDERRKTRRYKVSECSIIAHFLDVYLNIADPD